jgi:DNA polymerase III subunit delta
MKLAGRSVQTLIAKPDRTIPGVLLYGGDPVRVDARRADLTRALGGPGADDEMRVTRISAAELRKDPALLLDALKAVSFFPGPRVAVVEDAGDGLTATIAPALDDWRDGDAQIIVTAGALAAKSSLRKAFEDHGKALAIAFYDDPLSPAEVEAALAEAQAPPLPRETLSALADLAAGMDIAAFRQLAEKIALYKLGDATPMTLAELALLATPIGAEVDETIAVIAEGDVGKTAAALRKLTAQGTGAVSLIIAATRHFRTLHRVKSDPRGVAAIRPPLFGPMRDKVERQAQGWPMAALESAIEVLTETDLRLRSSSKAPDGALVERALLRVAALRRR